MDTDSPQTLKKPCYTPQTLVTPLPELAVECTNLVFQDGKTTSGVTLADPPKWKNIGLCREVCMIFREDAPGQSNAAWD